jgi:hypothetical protein
MPVEQAVMHLLPGLIRCATAARYNAFEGADEVLMLPIVPHYASGSGRLQR